MNKKFLSAILFGAFMLTSTGTFVSCKDYDDDINNLQEQIDANKTAIAALDTQIKSGQWVSSVTSTANGIVVTLGNGTSYTITNGEDGDNGATPKIAVNDGKIQVSYDNGANWTDLVALEDLKGAAAETPLFSVGEDGHIYVQYGEEGEKVDLGISTGGIFYVEEGVKLTLHVPNAEGEYEDIVLPRAASISSIAALTIDANAAVSNGATVELAYGIAAADGKYLDGTAFKKGAILLPTKEANGKISAQVNPTIADATVYDFYLINSKGNTIFNLDEATPNMTEKALSRAATANKGVYDMGISFIDGVTLDQINKANGTYAIATKDAYDNEVLSAYDVEVALKEAGNSSVGVTTYKYQRTEINKPFDLSSVVKAENIIDIQYYFATDQQANVDKAGAKIEGTMITGTVANTSVIISMKYLDRNGQIVESYNKIGVMFINKATEDAFTKELTLTGDKAKDILTFDITEIVGNTTSSWNCTIGDAKFTVDTKDYADTEYKKGAVASFITKPAAITTKNAGANGAYNGYYTHTLTYAVDAATAIPGTYEAVLTYGRDPENSVKLTIVIVDPSATFDFKPLDLYFTGNDAVAYGTPNGTTIDYNLTGLFGISNWTNVAFSETTPKAYKDADEVVWTAQPWLTSTFGAITVDKVAYKSGKVGVFGGAYEARAMAVTYTPFANKNLAGVKYDFNLTIKSAVYEGTLSYVRETKDDKGNITGYVAGIDKVINVAEQGAKAVLLGSEIRGITKTAVTYFANSNLDKAHIVSATAALEGDNAKQYLDIAGNFADGYTVTPKANVTLPSDGKSVTCYVRVSVLDQWGKTKTVDVPVVLK